MSTVILKFVSFSAVVSNYTGEWYLSHSPPSTFTTGRYKSNVFDFIIYNSYNDVKCIRFLKIQLDCQVGTGSLNREVEPSFGAGFDFFVLAKSEYYFLDDRECYIFLVVNNGVVEIAAVEIAWQGDLSVEVGKGESIFFLSDRREFHWWFKISSIYIYKSDSLNCLNIFIDWVQNISRWSDNHLEEWSDINLEDWLDNNLEE